MFEEFVCNLYSDAIKNKKFVNTSISTDQLEYKHRTNKAEFMFEMDKKKSYSILFSKDKFLKNASGKPVFDFILTRFSTNAKRLIFVDITLSDQ